MAHVDYLHICDYAFVVNGVKFFLIGIYTELRADVFPALHSRMYFAMRITGASEETIPVRLSVTTPAGAVLGSLTFDATMGTDGSALWCSPVDNVTFPQPGRYTVTVSSGRRVLASTTLLLTQGPSRPSEMPPSVAPGTTLH